MFVGPCAIDIRILHLLWAMWGIGTSLLAFYRMQHVDGRYAGDRTHLLAMTPLKPIYIIAYSRQ